MSPAHDACATVVVRAADGTVLERCPIGVRPDLALVDALARLHCALRHVGYTLELLDPAVDLRDLLSLVGLADVLTDPRPPPPGAH